MLILCLLLKVRCLLVNYRSITSQQLFFNILVQVAVLYISAHFFASLGGANSMDSSNLTTSSVYEPLCKSYVYFISFSLLWILNLLFQLSCVFIVASSMENSGAAMYYPSQGNPLATSNSSFTDSLRPQMGKLIIWNYQTYSYV